ncbi:MAG TPA: hypothetical protein VKV21_01730 [Solirubrobacteraceae bacterium]|nr:hypothetical protein [Solirubrobacteraceae bacterium]
MKSLQRDLFERRLWPLAIVIVAAIVAVPFVLHSHRANADIAPPPPVKAQPGSPAGAAPTPKTRHQPVAPTSRTRDPFQAAAVQRQTHTTTSSTGSGATTRSSPSSTSTGGRSGGGVGSSSASGAAVSTSATTSTPTPPVATTPIVTKPVTAPTHPSVPARTWRIYAVDIRIGASGDPRGYRDIARLTPLPSERSPQAMYMGVTDHGRSAVFALGAAVAVRGLGTRRSAGAFCSPSRVDCALVVIPAGKSVALSYVNATGAVRPLILRVRRIALHLTHSARIARIAQRHVSAVGLCDLKLGDPIGFIAPDTGNRTLPTTGSCRRDKHAVPFPGSIGAGSGERG